MGWKPMLRLRSGLGTTRSTLRGRLLAPKRHVGADAGADRGVGVFHDHLHPQEAGGGVHPGIDKVDDAVAQIRAVR